MTEIELKNFKIANVMIKEDIERVIGNHCSPYDHNISNIAVSNMNKDSKYCCFINDNGSLKVVPNMPNITDNQDIPSIISGVFWYNSKPHVIFSIDIFQYRFRVFHDSIETTAFFLSSDFFPLLHFL